MVNALSEWANVEVVRGGKRHFLSFERGKTRGDLVTEDAGADALEGTVVRFLPDPQVTKILNKIRKQRGTGEMNAEWRVCVERG